MKNAVKPWPLILSGLLSWNQSSNAADAGGLSLKRPRFLTASFLALTVAVLIHLPLEAAEQKERATLFMEPIYPHLQNSHIQIIEGLVTSNTECSTLPSGHDVAQIIARVMKDNEKDFPVTKEISVVAGEKDIDPGALKVIYDIDVRFNEEVSASTRRSRSIRNWIRTWVQADQRPATRNIDAYLPFRFPCDASLNREIIGLVEQSAQSLARSIKRSQGVAGQK